MRHYNAYSAFLKKKFGIPVGKLPISGGFSCPNRDGTKSRSGCVFCDNRAFSPAAGATIPPLEQLQKSLCRAGSRYKAFIAYLQPFSNTYAPLDVLREVYEPLVSAPGVVGLSIGTRPDCLSDGICGYLADLATRTFVSIELGLQSSHDATLSLVNRGHRFADFTAAVERLAGLGIETVAHVILGLPGESNAMMFETAERLAALPVTGVKIHQLMILRNTPLEQWYAEAKAMAFTIEEYAPVLCDFLERLRPDQHIHRIMADSRKEIGLIAPDWSACKQSSIRFLHNYMNRENVFQGKRYKM